MNPDRVRELFQEVPPPPGLARWRTTRAEAAPAPAPTGRLRPPTRPAEQRTGQWTGRWRPRTLLLAASAALATLLAGGLPIAVQLARAPHEPGPGTATQAPETAVQPPGTGATPGTPAGTATTRPPAGGSTARALPGAGNTGVPVGTRLRTHEGDLVVKTAGTVVDAMQVNGSIIVEAANVTIRRSRVVSRAAAHWVIRQAPGATNLVVEDTEIVGGPTHVGVSQETAGLTVRRAHIRSVGTGVSIGSRTTVEDSYLHEVAAGIGGSFGSERVTIRHNVVTTTKDSGEAAIGLYTTRGSLKAVVVEDNVLAGGSYAFHVGEGSGTQEITARRNRFSRAVHPRGGRYGPVAGWDRAAPGNSWTDNVWDEDGTPILL